MKYLLRAFYTTALIAIIPTASIASTVEIYDYSIAKTNPSVKILDFESGSTGVPTPNDIKIGSVTFSGRHGQGTLNYFSSNNIPSDEFGEQFLGNAGASRYTDISANFLEPVNFAGAWLMWAGNLESIQTIEFSAYGTNNELLYSKQLAAPQYFDQIYFFGIYADQSIKKVVWHPIEDSFFRLDNLSYGAISSTIPEPNTGALLLLGLIGVVSSQRKGLIARLLWIMEPNGNSRVRAFNKRCLA